MPERPPKTLPPERHCPDCGKLLSRFNAGPQCFACESTVDSPPRRRRRRADLPHDMIVARFREVGDTARVAGELDLPRSSVWYVIQRARRDGRLPGCE